VPAARLRLCAGISVEQAGEVLGNSRVTAFRHGPQAHAWLHAQFHES
jgi:hypothetical protein